MNRKEENCTAFMKPQHRQSRECSKSQIHTFQTILKKL